MRGSQKSKRVTWASDVNLCQVRLFLSEESPSQVGIGIQDHLQAKAQWQLDSAAVGSDDNLPPGFEGVQPADPWRAKLSQIPLIKWKRPPKFEVDNTWLVVAGDESREMEAQIQRELGVLEAIYPRPSAIPPNPSRLIGAEDSNNIHHLIHVIPITPIEEDEPVADATNYSIVPGAQNLSQGSAGPDIVAAAQAALTSIMSKSDNGNLVDHQLLIKLLSDPNMIQQLVSNHAAASSTQSVASSSTQNFPTSNVFHSSLAIKPQVVMPSQQGGVPATTMQNLASSSAITNTPSTSTQYPHITKPEPVALPRATSTGPCHPPCPVGSFISSGADAISVTSSSVGAPMTKDINYYKSLIQQHGGEKRETLAQQYPRQEPMKPREVKPRIMKPCMYFNTARGCRNGANCAFQHDSTPRQRVNNISEAQNAKRMKLDREITGT